MSEALNINLDMEHEGWVGEALNTDMEHEGWVGEALNKNLDMKHTKDE